MSLREQIDADIKKAMLAQKKEELIALRGIKSMILLAETEKGAGDVSAETENKILMKAFKQRKESAEIFQREGRNDLAQKENFEMEVVARYLPKPLTEAELTEELKKIISQTGASGAKDLGKVMSAAKALAGKADGKTISELAKKLLA